MDITTYKELFMPTVSDFQSVINSISASIPSSGTTTPAIDLGGTSLVGIQLPAAFTGTSISFTVATTLSGTYQGVIDGSGTALSKTIAAGKYLMLDPSEFAGIQFLKIVSSATEAAQRDLILITRPV
jgi:hypothetical protein